jgi:glycerol-3-phosphate acyltransferase PlsY
MLPVLVVIVAYLLGSIPFGYLIVRAREGADVRETGSGGTGATNVTRRAGKIAGVLTLVCDALKGLGAVLLARWLATPDFGINWTVAAAAIAVMLGHIFPVWLGFRGGKGVATGVGVFLALSPMAIACSLALFVPIVILTRYISLGSIVAAAALPIFVWVFITMDRIPGQQAPLVTAAVLGAGLIVVMHRDNIRRLRNGTENRFK